jgi:hypothetical protein
VRNWEEWDEELAEHCLVLKVGKQRCAKKFGLINKKSATLHNIAQKILTLTTASRTPRITFTHPHNNNSDNLSNTGKKAFDSSTQQNFHTFEKVIRYYWITLYMELISLNQFIFTVQHNLSASTPFPTIERRCNTLPPALYPPALPPQAQFPLLHMRSWSI